MLHRSACVVMVMGTVPCLAAQETTGRLQGRVVTEGRAPIAAIHIAVTGSALQGERLVRVNDAGYFVAQALPAGDYRARFRAIGFRELVAEEITIRLGQTTSLGEVVLRRSEVLLAPIVVRYDAAAIDPLSTEISSTLDVRFAETLPIGRDYTSLVTLLSQANASHMHRDGVNVAGATGLENMYFIDGMNVTEGFRNGAGTNLPHSFIDHIVLKTGGYEPEFGRALGGIISVTTRSGSNTPFASAFSYYTTSSLASNSARTRFDFGTGRFARYDVGAAVGGPIVMDRLWYFAAYDAAVAREDLQLPGGRQEDKALSHQFAGKLTWRASPETRVTATVVGDPTTRDMVGNSFWGGLPMERLANPEPYLGYWNQGSVAASIAANRAVGAHLLLEANVSHVDFHDRTGPRTAAGASVPLVVDFLTGEWSGGYGNQWDRRGSRSAVALSASHETGLHTTKIGAQLEENRQRESWQWIGNGPAGAGTIFRTGTSEYIGLLLDLQTRVRNRVSTLFAQTSILAHERLRVNGGVRWDAQSFYSPTTGRSGSITDQLQPRIGAVMYPVRSQTQKIAASFGRFYEQIPNQPITWFWGGLQQRFFLYDHDPQADPSGGIPIAWDDVPASGLKGQHYDELTLGYETNVAGSATLAVRGSRRRLREVLQEIGTGPPPAPHVLANPGRGEFSGLPAPSSRYDALELSLRRLADADFAFMVSYVLSKKFGNYVGLFNQDNGNPNAQAAAVTNFDGLLPNDRRHVFKTMISYRVATPFNLGAAFSVQSGTPLTEFGKRGPGPGSQYFLSARGAAGRTPTLWDLGLRGTYDFAGRGLPADTRIIVDVLHAFSQRKPVRVEQVRFLSVDASDNPTSPNPFYGSGLQFQPPMTFRVGVEIGSKSRPDGR